MKRFLPQFLLTALMHNTFYCMETQQPNSNTVQLSGAETSTITKNLEDLTIKPKQEEPLLITKDHIDKNREAFKDYVKRTKKRIKNPLSKGIIAVAGKLFEKKRQKKENAAEPTSFLGVKGAEPDDIHFLNPYLAKNHKTARESAINEFGSHDDLLRIHEILKAVKNLTAQQIEEKRISILHEQVVIYLNEKTGTTKKELREKVKKDEIKQDIYFKATTMSLYGAFVLDPLLPQVE